MSQKARKNPKRNARRRRAPGGQEYPIAVKRRQVNTMQRIGPDTLDITLTYPLVETGGSTLNGIQWRWMPNAVYDVDPTLGSTSTPGFAEEAALYSAYRVVSATGKFTITNLSTSAAMCYAVWSNGDPGTTASNVFPANANTVTRPLAPLGTTGAQRTLVTRMGFASLLGQNVIDTSQEFSSAVNSTPTDILWLAFGAFPITGTFSANLNVYGLITMHVRFFKRKFNLTTFQSLADSQRQLATDWLLRQIDKAQKLITLPTSALTATDTLFLPKAKALCFLSPEDPEFLEKGMRWFQRPSQTEL